MFKTSRGLHEIDSTSGDFYEVNKKNPTSIQAIFAERWTPTYIALFMRNYLHTSHDALFACFCPIVYAHFRFELMFQTSIVTKYKSIATFSKKNERDWSYRTSVIASLSEALCTGQVRERRKSRTKFCILRNTCDLGSVRVR